MSYKQLINGRLVKGKGEILKILNPSTEEVITTIDMVTEEQTKEALQAAGDAFVKWSKTSIAERESYIRKIIALLKQNKETVVECLIEETGKSREVAEYDFDMLPNCLNYFIEEVKRLEGEEIADYDNKHLNIVIRKPLGVIACHLAWNYPLLNVGYKLGPILASGCTCVLKPSSETPLATLMVAELINEAGIPKGVVNIIVGKGSCVSKIMNESTIPNMITLIGSTNTGLKAIKQSTTSIKKFSLELGGSAPVIVTKNSDAYKAGMYTAEGKTGNSGQVCVAPNRIFVHKDKKEEFMKGVNEYLDKISFGTGYHKEGVLMGPLVNKNAVIHMEELVRDAIEKGAELVRGGKRYGQRGFYFEPTVLVNVNAEMRVYKEEIFGPIMPIVYYDDSDDIVSYANDTQFGLAAYVYTKDLKDALDLGINIDAGSVCINEPFYSYQLPHGGCKQSGIGKDCSRISLEEYFTAQRISIKK